MAISTIGQNGLNAPLSLTSPTFTTPNSGTPSAINLSNATALAKAALPAGSVLQVVSATKTDVFSVSSSDFVDVTGLSVSITPTSASSKILIMVHLHCDSTVGGYTNPWRMMRNSTPICIGDANSGNRQATGGGTSVYTTGPLQGVHQAAQYLDSPATTSATTYKIQLATYTNSGGTSYINRGADDGTAITYSRYASAITVMEIAG